MDFFRDLKENLDKNDTLSNLAEGVTEFIGELAETLIKGGNEADIVCDYGDFCVNIEVTLQTGQKQYDNEGEPVARHIGKQIATSGKPTYCFFIAPKITPATYAHFYVLYHENIELYGGRCNIVPLELTSFEKMIVNSKEAKFVPSSRHIKAIFDNAKKLRETAGNEREWFEQVNKMAQDWLTESILSN